MKKSLACLLSTCLILSILSACGGSPASSASSAEQDPAVSSVSAPISAPEPEPSQASLPDSSEPESSTLSILEPEKQDESTTLNYFPVNDVSISWWFSYVDDITPDDSQFFQQMQERTGVTIAWQCPNKQTAAENFNLMIASGDWTDMVTGLGGMYTTGLNGALEEARAAKVIGKSLEADVHLTVAEGDVFLADESPEALADLFIVSKVELTVGSELAVRVENAAGTKCPRCWKHSLAPNAEGLCPRCAKVVKHLPSLL